MHVILTIVLNTIAVIVTSQILSGVAVSGIGSAVIVALLFSLFNMVLRPILLILTLPINILTLGLFTFVIMGLIVWLVAAIAPGFYVANFWWAIAFAIIMSLFNMLWRRLRGE